MWYIFWIGALLLMCLQWIGTGEHLEEKDSEAEPVDREGVELVLHHLRGHVLEGTAESACAFPRNDE